MNGYYERGSKFEAQAWLWQRKVLLGVLGGLVVIGLLVGGSGL